MCVFIHTWCVGVQSGLMCACSGKAADMGTASRASTLGVLSQKKVLPTKDLVRTLPLHIGAGNPWCLCWCSLWFPFLLATLKSTIRCVCWLIRVAGVFSAEWHWVCAGLYRGWKYLRDSGYLCILKMTIFVDRNSGQLSCLYFTLLPSSYAKYYESVQKLWW